MTSSAGRSMMAAPCLSNAPPQLHRRNDLTLRAFALNLLSESGIDAVIHKYHVDLLKRTDRQGSHPADPAGVHEHHHLTERAPDHGEIDLRHRHAGRGEPSADVEVVRTEERLVGVHPVSYTHLTLPTIYSV